MKACALQQDIDMLPGGDSTEIGEKVKIHLIDSLFTFVFVFYRVLTHYCYKGCKNLKWKVVIIIFQLLMYYVENL